MDRVIFRSVEIFEPQLFGFGEEASTRVENYVVIQSRDIFGKYHDERSFSLETDPLPEVERHGTFDMRFTLMERHAFYEDGWEIVYKQVRYQTKNLLHITKREYREP